MFTDPFSNHGVVCFFPIHTARRMILKTPTIAKIAVFAPNNIVIDFHTQRAFIVWTIKIEIFCV
jgi:hypothetical protein